MTNVKFMQLHTLCDDRRLGVCRSRKCHIIIIGVQQLLRGLHDIINTHHDFSVLCKFREFSIFQDFYKSLPSNYSCLPLPTSHSCKTSKTFFSSLMPATGFCQPVCGSFVWAKHRVLLCILRSQMWSKNQYHHALAKADYLYLNMQYHRMNTFMASLITVFTSAVEALQT